MTITLATAYHIADAHMSSAIMKSRLKNIHIAMILKGKKVIAVATNVLGTRAKGCGFTDRTIHAERAVIKKVGDYKLLQGAIMVVIRITCGIRNVSYSKPCEKCMPHLEKCIKKYGLKCVFYSE